MRLRNQPQGVLAPQWCPIGALLEIAWSFRITAIPTYFFVNSDLTVGKITEGFPGDDAVLSSAQALY